jgi:hypothetical protein
VANRPSLESIFGGTENGLVRPQERPSLEELFSDPAEETRDDEGGAVERLASGLGVEPSQEATYRAPNQENPLASFAAGTTTGAVGDIAAEALNPQAYEARTPVGGALSQRVFDNKLYYTGYLAGQAAQFYALRGALKWFDVGAPLATEVVKNGLIIGASSFANNADVPDAWQNAALGSLLSFGGEMAVKHFSKAPKSGLTSNAVTEAAAVEAEQFPKTLGQYLDGLEVGKVTKTGPAMNIASLAIDNVLGRIPFISELTGKPSLRENMKRLMSIVRGESSDAEVDYLTKSAGELFEGASDSMSKRALDFKKSPEAYRARGLMEGASQDARKAMLKAKDKIIKQKRALTETGGELTRPGEFISDLKLDKKTANLEKMRIKLLAEQTEGEIDKMVNRAFQIEKNFMPKAQELLKGYQAFSEVSGKQIDMAYPLRVLDTWVTSRMDDVARNLPEIKIDPELTGIQAAKEVASKQKEILKAYGKVMGEFERLPLVQEIMSIGQRDLSDEKIMLNLLRGAEALSKESGFQKTHAESLVSLLTAYRRSAGDRKAMAAAAKAELGAIDAIKAKNPEKAIDIVEKFFKIRENMNGFLKSEAAKAIKGPSEKPLPGSEPLKTDAVTSAYQAADFNRSRREGQTNAAGAGRAAKSSSFRTPSDQFRDQKGRY